MYAEGVDHDFDKVCPDFQGKNRFTQCLFDEKFGVYTYYPRVFNRDAVLAHNITKLSFDYFAKQKKKALDDVENATKLEYHAKQFLKNRAMFPHEVRTATFPSPKYVVFSGKNVNFYIHFLSVRFNITHLEYQSSEHQRPNTQVRAERFLQRCCVEQSVFLFRSLVFLLDLSAHQIDCLGERE